MDLEAEIVSMIKDSNGLKVGDLLLEMRRKFPLKTSEKEVLAVVEELVEAKKIMEVEYIIDYTSASSFLVPAKTAINVRGQDNSPRRI